MQISAKADYAVRALLCLAAHAPGPITAGVVVDEQKLPPKYVEGILAELRRAGLVRAQRGAGGGYSLGRPADQIPLGAVLRAVDGPLSEVHGLAPDETSYTGVAVHLRDVWIAIRASLREVLDATTVADVLTGDLPVHVRALVEAPGAGQRVEPAAQSAGLTAGG
jgi:Rrf2 family protein